MKNSKVSGTTLGVRQSNVMKTQPLPEKLIPLGEPDMWTKDTCSRMHIPRTQEGRVRVDFAPKGSLTQRGNN